MTEETKTLLIIVIIATFLIGFFLGRVIPSKKSKQAKSTQKQLNDYQKAVSNHFEETANLIDNLTDSYKAVFDHLGSSAQNLLSTEEIDKLRASREHKITTLEYLALESAAQKDNAEIIENSIDEQSEKDINTNPNSTKKTTEKNTQHTEQDEPEKPNQENNSKQKENQSGTKINNQQRTKPKSKQQKKNKSSKNKTP